MAKKFVPESEKWGVKISIDKRRITRSSSVQRRVVIHNSKPSDSNNKKEKWHVDLKKFIADSKNEIDIQARTLIESAKKWQQIANEKFDMIQQHITGEHNLQNSLSSSSVADEERSTERAIEPPTGRPTKQIPRPSKKVCFPSMPVLITDSDARDDLKRFLTEPPASLPPTPLPPTDPKKIAKRRNTVCIPSPKSDRDFPVRKVSRGAPTSMLAVSGGQPKSVSKPKEQTPVATSDSPKSIANASNSSGSKEEQTSPAQSKDDIFKKFLETREIVLARQKQRESDEAARLNGQNGEPKND